MKFSLLAMKLMCAAAIFAPSASLAQELPAAVKEAGVLRFGVKCDSPPFGATGTDGKPVGIEIEMANAIAAYGFGEDGHAELTCVSSDARIPMLDSKRIDLILATLGKFPAREEVIDFSDVYFWGTSNVIVAKDSAAQNLADFNGKTIILVKGASQMKWLEANLKDVQFLQLNTTADAIQALVQGRGDGFVAGSANIWALASKNPNLRVVEEGFELGVNGIGLRKGESDLKAFVDAALAKLKADKFYDGVVPKFVDDELVRKVIFDGFTEAPPAIK